MGSYPPQCGVPPTMEAEIGIGRPVDPNRSRRLAEPDPRVTPPQELHPYTRHRDLASYPSTQQTVLSRRPSDMMYSSRYNVNHPLRQSQFAQVQGWDQASGTLFDWNGKELASQHPADWSLLSEPVDGMASFEGGEFRQLAASQQMETPPILAMNHKLDHAEDEDEYNARRKEKNRLAQKAFRERKEKYVKALERKLNELESRSMFLEEENRHLKADLASLLPTHDRPNHNVLSDELLDKGMGPDTAPEGPTDKDFGGQYIRISKDARGKLVNAENTCEMIRTVWELIQANDLFEKRAVDLRHVYDQLMEIARHNRSDFTLEDAVQQILSESPSHTDHGVL